MLCPRSLVSMCRNENPARSGSLCCAVLLFTHASAAHLPRSICYTAVQTATRVLTDPSGHIAQAPSSAWLPCALRPQSTSTWRAHRRSSMHCATSAPAPAPRSCRPPCKRCPRRPTWTWPQSSPSLPAQQVRVLRRPYPLHLSLTQRRHAPLRTSAVRPVPRGRRGCCTEHRSRAHLQNQPPRPLPSPLRRRLVLRHHRRGPVEPRGARCGARGRIPLH